MILGGRTASGICWYYAGNRLRFAQLDVSGDPRIDNVEKWGLMFNPSAFRFNSNSGFEVRTNLNSYPGVQGPGYKNVDFNLAKFFRINERVRVEFKMEA